MDSASANSPTSAGRRKLLGYLAFGVGNLAVLGQVGNGGVASSLSLTTSSDFLGPGTAAAEISPAGPQKFSLPPAMPTAGAVRGPGHTFDKVIINGRVIDPESGFDGMANIGIDGDKITQISAELIVGRETIDATERIVAPGFIDLLSYEPNQFGTWFKLADGVTTNLAMHGVSNYSPAFFTRYENLTPIHFGGAFHHHFMRGVDLLVSIDAELPPTQVNEMVALFENQLANGYAGISFSPEYSPGTSTAEMTELAALAKKYDQTCFFHSRHSGLASPELNLASVAEVIQIAKETGASCHIQHITSTGGTYVMGEALAMIEEARGEDLDITACLYPYDFWGTFLASARFSDGWQQRYGISYQDLQVAGTNRRLNQATFVRARAENLVVAAIGSIPEADIVEAMARPWAMVASDAILNRDRNNHPRAAGTFARTLGKYVRDGRLLDLRTGLAKITILPAKRVEKMIPAMANKGRLRRGADADIVVFDILTIADRATIAEPDQASVGIDWVLVDGQIALASGVPQTDVLAGKPLRSQI